MSAERIIIYGAGKAAKNIVHFLDSLEINNYIFAVTGTPTQAEKNVAGAKEIYSISELKEYRETALVIIASIEKSFIEMEKYLKSLNFKKYMVLTRKKW